MLRLRIRLCIFTLFAVYVLLAIPALATEPPASGAAEYTRHCQGCHNLAGVGRDTLYPSLAEADLSRRSLIETLLHGRFDRAGEQAGQTIPVMPSWWSLDDATLARIATYVASLQDKSWRIAPGEIAAVRTLGELSVHTGLPSETIEQPVASAGIDGSTLYAEQCAGCHGINREGAAGPALPPGLMAALGRDALVQLVHFGSSEGMPAWGMSERLSFDELDALASYLTTQQIVDPTFDLAAVQATHERLASSQVQSATRPTSELMVVLTHDPGQAVLIHAPSRDVVAVIETADAPLQAALASDGRHLAVLSRGGQISLIDLWPETPAEVARVRVGYQANAIAASTRDGGFLVGAYAPSQLVQLSDDLSPVALWPTTDLLTENDSRIVDIAATGRGRYVALTQGAGLVTAAPRLFRAALALSAHPMKRHLTIGRLMPGHNALVASSSLHEVLVWDTAKREVAGTTSTPRFSNGNAGTALTHPTLGELWVASSITSKQLVAISPTGVATDGALISVPEHGAGSLFIAAHPSAPETWSDRAANADAAAHRSLTVTDFGSEVPSITRLPVADWAETSASARVVSPALTASGDEVWVAVWARQDEAPAVVAIDRERRSLSTVIKHEAIISPTRVISLGDLCRRRGDLSRCQQ